MWMDWFSICNSVKDDIIALETKYGIDLYDTKSYNANNTVVLSLVQRLRRWTNDKPTLIQLIASAWW